MSDEQGTTEQPAAAPAEPGASANTSGKPVDPASDEVMSARDAAAAAVDEMTAAEAGDATDDEQVEAAPDVDATAEPAEPEADAEPAADSDAEPQKPSGRVREAHRRQRAAERKLQEAQALEQRLTEKAQGLDARDKEWTTFETELKRNPLQAIAQRMGITVPRLIAAYGEDARKDVPEAVSLEIESLRKELRESREEAKTARETREKTERAEKYQRALDSDAKLISGLVDDDAQADKYPYFAALPPEMRARRARSLQDYVVKNMPNPAQYTEDDLLEALDAKERDRITNLEKAGVIKWLGRKRREVADADDVGDATPSKRPRTPSAGKAATGAPALKDMTEDQLRRQAAKIVDELRAADR